MDPQSLVNTQYPNQLPAPFWFIEFFKVLGFALHAFPMSLWYAGILLAMGMSASGHPLARRASWRLMRQMPLMVAYGVNLGIVPLLFVQVGYAAVFYPATILMAWFWLGIIVLLIPAYYGVYLYGADQRQTDEPVSGWRMAAGVVSGIFFVVIGFLFANGFSLMTNLGAWSSLWQQQEVAGATLGLALNTSDPTLWSRWLMMFGLAITTTAAWLAIDGGLFGRGEPEAYRLWVGRFAVLLYLVGVAVFGAFGLWYSLAGWSVEVQTRMWYSGWVVLTVLTALSPIGVLALLGALVLRGKPLGPWEASAIGLAQFIVLLLNAASRQLVQNLELSAHFQPWQMPVALQVGPLGMFLAAFVLGAVVVGWMIFQTVRSLGKVAPGEP